MGGASKGRVRDFLVAVLAAAGCATHLEPLPPTPEPSPETPPPAVEDPAERDPLAEPQDPLAPSVDGERILPGVVLLAPVLLPGAATATFGLRNEGGRDLPDLILVVVFAVREGVATAPLRPRLETVEAALRKGETREFRVTSSSVRAGDRVEGFRVAPGLPEVLSAPEVGAPGTTFLGGLLECVALDVDLTSDAPQVTVSLAERNAAAGGTPLPPLEAQLLLGRAGRLVWTGPWILVPKPDAESGNARRIRWNLHDAPGVAACVLFLRVRERR